MNQTKHPLWVTDLSNYTPLREGHWPAFVAGFTLSKSGRIWLTDNNAIKIKDHKREGVLAPCHRDLIDGEGDDQTCFSGLYCFNPKDKNVTLWLYQFATLELNDAMKQGLKSLIGVHRITSETTVSCNTGRKVLFKLGDV